MFKKIALFVVIALGVAHAQGAPSIDQGHKKPGDALHYYVRFEGNPKLIGVNLHFDKADALKPNQTGFQHTFEVSEIKEFSPGVIEVNGTIPVNVASGTYELVWVDVVPAPLRLSKRYGYPADFKDSIKLDIVNEASVNYPAIKSITPDPPKQ